VQVGDIIVQLDKDSVMPPDVIRATVPEFLDDPTLAYTQHASYPTNEERYFSVVSAGSLRLLYDLAIPAKCLIPGTICPPVATTYSCVARISCAWVLGTNTRCAKDLTLCLRLHESGSHGNTSPIPGTAFGEAVTRIYTEDSRNSALRLRRRGSRAESDLRWEHRGIVTQSWRRFCRSEHVRWFQVVDLFQFLLFAREPCEPRPDLARAGLGSCTPTKP